MARGGGGGGGADLAFLLPLITGASSFLGAIFAYFILPVWVAYILNDKTTLVATFDQSLPKAVAVRHLGGHQDGRA